MDDRHARHRRRPVDGRRHPSAGHRALSSAAFDRLVDRAVATLPPGLLDYMSNVQIVVEDVPPPDVLPDGSEGILLGLYEGVPHTERAFGDPLLPDRIAIYRRPIEMRARTRSELAEIVMETVVHEIAHHFGIDDDRLDELGWA